MGTVTVFAVAALLTMAPAKTVAVPSTSLRASPLVAQPQARIATTIDALLTYPVFYHGRTVVVRGTLDERDGFWSLTSAGTERRIHVLTKSTRPDAGAVEARGEFWDLGRLQQEDPRFAGYDMDRFIERVSQGRWPGQNQVFILALDLAGAAAAAPSTQATTIRAVALEPDKYDGHKVTVTGRFRGVNLFGDLPQAPGRSRYDFVLQSADAALWVTGLQPKGKNFSLDRNARVDTGRWLEVTGTVGRSAGLVWIDGEKIGLGTAPEPAAVVQVEVPKVGPAPEITFSIPTPEDIDVETTVLVRIQFSRDMEAASFKDRVRVRYVTPPAEGGPTSPPLFSTAYREGTKVLEIKFSGRLDRFRIVEIELQDGIAAFDSAKLVTPWKLTFTTGAQ
jgi:Bacterial Ig-like domain